MSNISAVGFKTMPIAAGMQKQQPLGEPETPLPQDSAVIGKVADPPLAASPPAPVKAAAPPATPSVL